MKTLLPYLEADIYNGPVYTERQANMAGISPAGCPHRGTTTCWHCAYAPVWVCSWTCLSCVTRDLCPCGSPHLIRYPPQVPDRPTGRTLKEYPP